MNSIKEARQNGFRVTVNHYRYQKDQVDNVRKVVNLMRDGNEKFYFPINKQKKLLKLFNAEPVNSADIVGSAISPFGGVTKVTLEKNGAFYYGISECHIVDNFKRNEGISRAFGRAVSAFKKASRFSVKGL